MKYWGCGCMQEVFLKLHHIFLGTRPRESERKKIATAARWETYVPGHSWTFLTEFTQLLHAESIIWDSWDIFVFLARATSVDWSVWLSAIVSLHIFKTSSPAKVKLHSSNVSWQRLFSQAKQHFPPYLSVPLHICTPDNWSSAGPLRPSNTHSRYHGCSHGVPRCAVIFVAIGICWRSLKFWNPWDTMSMKKLMLQSLQVYNVAFMRAGCCIKEALSGFEPASMQKVTKRVTDLSAAVIPLSFRIQSPWCSCPFRGESYGTLSSLHWPPTDTTSTAGDFGGISGWFSHIKKRGPMKARQNCNLTFGRSTTGEVTPSWSPSPCWWFLTSGCALVGGLSHDSAFGGIQSCPLHHDRGKKHWIMESMKANHLLSDHGCCPKPPVWEKPTHETSTGTGVHRHA